MNKLYETRFHLFLLISFFVIFIWSLINPKDYFTWTLEVFPAVIVLIILLLTYKKFKLTNLAYSLIWIHAIILVIGGHYTYAEMPLFNWLKEIFNLQRNYYDRLGHFAQGFVPAIITREILLRKKIITNKSWLNFFVITTCLSISVSYEFLEWGAAELTGSAADAFLGTQGDIWDTQWDMFLALIGAISAIVSLSKLHDKSISKRII